MKNSLIFFVIYLLSATLHLTAQTPVMHRWEDVLEQWAESGEIQQSEMEQWLEEATKLRESPLNLNTVTRVQLEKLPFLTDLHIEHILAYQYLHGPLMTVHELSLVQDMDHKTIQYLLPFVCVLPVEKPVQLPQIKDVWRYGRHEAVARLDIPLYEREGYRSVYLGPAPYHSLRYAFHYRDQIYAGLTAEKDAGEPFGALHNRKGYDSYAFYLYLSDIGKLKTLAVGNYRLSWGRGLVVSHDFTIGKITSLNALHRKGNVIRRHASTDEYQYFNGAAAAVQWGRFVLSACYSHRRLDAIATSTEITSIQKTGLHRTQTEADRRGVAVLQVMGLNVAYRHPNGLTLGGTGLYYFFDRPYLPAQQPYSKFNLRGNYFHNLSVDYRYRLHNVELSGETAIGKYGIATLNSIACTLLSDYQLMLVQRYYSHDYWALFARSFSAGSTVQNEFGWYLAAEGTPLAYLNCFVSVDFFRYPWLKYQINKPSDGLEIVTQVTCSPRKKWSLLGKYRYHQQEKNHTDEAKNKSVRPYHNHRFRARMDYTPTDRLALRTTLDYTSVCFHGDAASQGFQCVQAASYSFQQLPLKLSVQGGYFHTDNYESRVYLTEKSLLYAFSSLSHYGEGTRWMLHARYDMQPHWMFIIKFGHTRYFDRESIGSAHDKIEGCRKQDIQMQVRWKI